MKKFYLIGGLGMSLIFSSSCVGLAQEKIFGISGSIEVGFEKKGEEKSNLSMGDIEVSLDVKLNDKVCGNVLLRPDTPQEILDEATIKLEKFHPLPISITVGKRVMPFGVFESHLISDPLTKEWENKSGRGYSRL